MMLYQVLFLSFIINASGQPAIRKEFINVAQGKRATQSSTWNNMAADRAVDGFLDSNVSHGYCSSTQNSSRLNKLSVDLGHSYKIYSVKITNRADYVASQRLKDFTVWVIPNQDATHPEPGGDCVAGTHPFPAGTTKEFNCYGGSIIGQTVIVAMRNNPLTICEIQVMADPIPVDWAPYIDFDAKQSKVVTGFIGQSVTLPCSFGGHPLPFKIFYYKEEMLPLTRTINGRYLKYKHTRRNLTIYSLNLADSGKYACKGFNDYGVKWYNYSLVVGEEDKVIDNGGLIDNGSEQQQPTGGNVEVDIPNGAGGPAYTVPGAGSKAGSESEVFNCKGPEPRLNNGHAVRRVYEHSYIEFECNDGCKDDFAAENRHAPLFGNSNIRAFCSSSGIWLPPAHNCICGGIIATTVLGGGSGDQKQEDSIDRDCNGMTNQIECLSAEVKELKESVRKAKQEMTSSKGKFNEAVAGLGINPSSDRIYIQDITKSRDQIDDKLDDLVNMIDDAKRVYGKKEGFFYWGAVHNYPVVNETIRVCKFKRYDWGEVYNKSTGVYTAASPGLHLVMVKINARVANCSLKYLPRAPLYQKIGFRLVLKGPGRYISQSSSASVNRINFEDSDQLSLTNVYDLRGGDKLWLEATAQNMKLTAASFSIVLIKELLL